jgi:hypothetical protein
MKPDRKLLLAAAALIAAACSLGSRPAIGLDDSIDNQGERTMQSSQHSVFKPSALRTRS